MDATLLTPSNRPIFVLGAIFTCFVGSHSALSLASASLRLRLVKLKVLTALLFSVQCIFALHFVGMSGIQLDVAWGFDVGFTLISLIIVASFSTGAITLALHLRDTLEPEVNKKFPAYFERPSCKLYARILFFLLQRVSFWKLTLSIVLMVVGGAGCHHVGMWSMRGIHGTVLMSQMTLWSLLYTVGVGGLACVLIILIFFTIPEGFAAWVGAAILCAGVGAFHFSSATWGMSYVLGVEGFTTHAVMGTESVILLVILQGSLSQVITSVFSQMAVVQCHKAEKELLMAQSLGWHIAQMNLEEAATIRMECCNPSPLEQVLFQIVSNLEQYRPYLPDTLFTPQNKPIDLPATETARSRTGSFVSSHTNTSTRAPTYICHTPKAGLSATVSAEGFSSFRERSKGNFKHLEIGLRRTRLAVLRIRLQGLDFTGNQDLGLEVLEDALNVFMALVTAEIKSHNGSIVCCAGGNAVGMWMTSCPDSAMECAMAIYHKSVFPVVQVLQCGHFMCGNLAAPQFRSFNLVGPLDWAGQQLLRMATGVSHIFVTRHEWDSVHMQYCCLPYERVVIDGIALTAYAVLPVAHGPQDEWMYSLAEHHAKFPMMKIEECWAHYTKGCYEEAKALATQLSGLPEWYVPHLLTLIDHASSYNIKDPTKILDKLAWISLQASGLPVSNRNIIRDK